MTDSKQPIDEAIDEMIKLQFHYGEPRDWVTFREALKALINTAVIAELERLPKNKLHDHVNDAGKRHDIAIVNYKFVEERIAYYKSKELKEK